MSVQPGVPNRLENIEEPVEFDNTHKMFIQNMIPIIMCMDLLSGFFVMGMGRRPVTFLLLKSLAIVWKEAYTNSAKFCGNLKSKSTANHKCILNGSQDLKISSGRLWRPSATDL